MKILVFSDTHGRYREMRAALARHAPTTDAVFFLGDGCRDLSRIKDDFPTVAFYSVLGNCDFGATGDGDIYERFVSLDGFRFLLMHGHRFGVKSGLESAVVYAKNKGADVLCMATPIRPVIPWMGSCTYSTPAASAAIITAIGPMVFCRR